MAVSRPTAFRTPGPLHAEDSRAARCDGTPTSKVAGVATWRWPLAVLFTLVSLWILVAIVPEVVGRGNDAVPDAGRTLAETRAAAAGSAVDADGMVLVPAARFAMGSAQGHDDEIPVHEVELSAYRIDATEVTNTAFARFVAATGYRTQAERDGGCWCYLRGASDFEFVHGADWRHPQGPASSIAGRGDHPVVCVTWNDAQAYATWAGKRLPTEAEWEYAARGGDARHFQARDGSASDPGSDPGIAAPERERTANDPAGGVHAAMHASGVAPHAMTAHEAAPEHDVLVDANVWQGTWPQQNTLEDGYWGTAPVTTGTPNAFGLRHVLGNVWEWTADWYAPDTYAHSPRRDPTGPPAGTYRVARGGSWFCSAGYCGAYNTHFRGASPPDHAFNNVGFRCAADATGARRASETPAPDTATDPTTRAASRTHPGDRP